jgi:hypothetical protein
VQKCKHNVLRQNYGTYGISPLIPDNQVYQNEQFNNAINFMLQYHNTRNEKYAPVVHGAKSIIE